MSKRGPPPRAWQDRGREFAAHAQGRLWDGGGDQVLTWLTGRGLLDETVWRFGLGYNPMDLYDEPHQWGLEDGKDIWLPCGVVIPCEMGKSLWYVKVRRLSGGEPEYVQPRGGRWALFGADHLRHPERPLLLCSREFDAMLADQVVGDLVDVAALAWANRGIPDHCLPYLLRYHLILIAYAGDIGDHRGAAQLVAYGKRVVRLQIQSGDDFADFCEAGGDLRYSMEEALLHLGYQPDSSGDEFSQELAGIQMAAVWEN